MLVSDAVPRDDRPTAALSIASSHASKIKRLMDSAAPRDHETARDFADDLCFDVVQHIATNEDGGLRASNLARIAVDARNLTTS